MLTQMNKNQRAKGTDNFIQSVTRIILNVETFVSQFLHTSQ